MKARIASTLTLWATVTLALVFGKAWSGIALLALLGAAAQWEFQTLLGKIGAAPRKALGVGLGLVLPLAVFAKAAGVFAAVPPAGELRRDMTVFLIAGLATTAVFYAQLVRHTALLPILRRLPTLFGVLGFGLMMSLYAWPAGIHHGLGGDITGILWGVWCVAVTKFTDVGGLLAGMAFGRVKLWPAVSPGKTREGCAGGIALSCAVGAGLAAAFGPHWKLDLPPAKAALTALPLAINSIPSDLVESVFKRLSGVKDSGRTIPGIGGAYDLADSLLLNAPVSLALYLAITA